MEKILPDLLSHVTLFGEMELLVLEKRGDTLVASGSDSAKRVLFRSEFETDTKFERVAVLGQLKFIKKILDQDEFKNSDDYTITFEEGQSITGAVSYKKIKFQSGKVKIMYHTIDPKVVTSPTGKLYPTLKELESIAEINITDDFVANFKQKAALQRMAAKKESFVNPIIENGHLLLRFPYADQKIDLEIEENTSFSLPSNLVFNTGKIESGINMARLNGSGTIKIYKECIDIMSKNDIGKYVARIAKETPIRRI